MSYAQLFAKIPWKQVIGFAPEIVAVAQKIYDNVKKTLGLKGGPVLGSAGKREPSLAELDKRVERLESNEVQQAELVRDMARQMGELSATLRIVSRRAFLAAVLAAAAVIGLVVLALKTWKQ
jgi:hypothetical protein